MSVSAALECNPRLHKSLLFTMPVHEGGMSNCARPTLRDPRDLCFPARHSDLKGAIFADAGTPKCPTFAADVLRSEPALPVRKPREYARGFKEGVAKLVDGGYQITFRYADEHGKLKRVRRSVPAKSLSEAYRAKDALREEMRAKVRARQDAAGGVLPLTVEAAVERFLIEYPLRRQLRASTKENMRHVLRSRLVPLLGERAISSLTIEDMQSLVTSWVQEVNPQRGKLYSRATVANWVNATRSFLSSDPRTSQLSPALKPPTGSKRHRGRALEAWEVAKLLRALGEDGPNDGEHQHYYALVVMALITGQRAGSILALRWEDIDFERRTIAFAKCHYRGEVNEGNKTGRYTKLKASRIEGLDLFDVLEAHRALIRDPRFKRHGHGRGELVFPPRQRSGEETCAYMSPETLTKLLKRLAQSLQLESLTIHDLRRTFVTRALNAGVPLDKVRSLVGHANEHTTLGYYAPSPSDHSETIAKTQRAIFAESAPTRALHMSSGAALLDDED